MIKQFADIPVITCFPGELNQVFMHGFRDAAQAISGFGTITVSTWTDQRKVFVRVEDTGRGIEPERVPTLFVPTLYRSGTRVRAGLGLFASSQIIERHHDLERRLNRAVVLPSADDARAC